MSRVIAFDISSFAFDYAVVTDGEIVGKQGRLLADKKLSTDERLLQLSDQLDPLMLWCTVWNINHVVVEEANYVRNAVTQRSLVTAIAYIHAAAHRAKLEFSTIHNSTWKANLGLRLFGKEREEQKASVLEAIHLRFPHLTDLSQDQADAIGVGLYASVPHEVKTKSTKKKRKPVAA